MTDANTHLQSVYDNLDALRERLELSGLDEEQKLLDTAREELNRYLMETESKSKE